MEHQKVEQIQIEKECQVVQQDWQHGIFTLCSRKFIGLYVARQYIIFIFDSTRVILLPTQTMRYYSGTPPKSTRTFALFDLFDPPKIHCFDPRTSLESERKNLKDQDAFNWGYDPVLFGAAWMSFVVCDPKM